MATPLWCCEKERVGTICSSTDSPLIGVKLDGSLRSVSGASTSHAHTNAKSGKLHQQISCTYGNCFVTQKTLMFSVKSYSWDRIKSQAHISGSSAAVVFSWFCIKILILVANQDLLIGLCVKFPKEPDVSLLGHLKILILSSCSHPHALPNLYDLSYVPDKCRPVLKRLSLVILIMIVQSLLRIHFCY